MPTELSFGVEFHGPVRVGTGLAAAGRDDTVDPTRIPASTLKGLMRAEARQLFPEHLVDATFGARRPSAWHWSDLTFPAAQEARFPAAQEVRVAARVRIDDQTHSVARGGLFLTEHLWPRTGTFQITRMARLTDAEQQDQSDVLLASALSVHSIGADRTRGSGWVSLAQLTPDPDPDLVERVLALATRTDPGGDR